MGKKRSSSGKSDPKFEDEVKAVNEIVRFLESGDASLSESLKKYEEGVAKLRRCHDLLDQAESQIALISGYDADGNPIQKPFPQDGQDTSAPQKTKRASSPNQANEGLQDDDSTAFGSLFE